MNRLEIVTKCMYNKIKAETYCTLSRKRHTETFIIIIIAFMKYCSNERISADPYE